MSAPRFVRVLSLADLPPGGGLPVEIEGRSIAVFNVDGVLHAIDNDCPHRGAPLVEGALNGSVVTCPMHRWQFDVSSGRNAVNPELRVRRHAVKAVDGEIWLDVSGFDASSESNPARP